MMVIRYQQKVLLKVTGEEQTQDLLQSIDELDKGVFTVKDGEGSFENG